MPKAAANSAPRSALRRRTARSGADLAALGLVPPERVAEVARVAERYAVAVTPALVDLIAAGDPQDPIARQFIPDGRELASAADEAADPIGDAAHSPRKGIVHRYPDRVLLIPILHCPVYCRFCFRRERVGGEEAMLSAPELAAALDYIRRHEEVWEVVITGGDPLMLAPKRLAALVTALDAIPHVAVIRCHSRVPVGDPARVSPALVAALASEKALWLAVHCNHPRELSPAAQAACRRLVKAGIPLLGQTVLLKGVNDDAAVMAALMRAMVQNRIKPYYLHHLDRAPGTAHFRTTIAEGQAILRRLRGRVSGLCQPSYVLDIPGGYGKAPIGPTYLHADGSIEDWRGVRHRHAAAP
ncbi:MAG: lysine-2,3-aminomutase-like protein [Alphaproteobacteria bacterium]